MENKNKFATSLNISSNWEEDGDKLVATFTNSDDFSDACVKLDNNSNLEELDSEGDINLEGITVVYNGYTEDEKVYHIKGVGNFVTDEYRIEIQ